MESGVGSARRRERIPAESADDEAWLLVVRADACHFETRGAINGRCKVNAHCRKSSSSLETLIYSATLNLSGRHRSPHFPRNSVCSSALLLQHTHVLCKKQIRRPPRHQRARVSGVCRILRIWVFCKSMGASANQPRKVLGTNRCDAPFGVLTHNEL